MRIIVTVFFVLLLFVATAEAQQAYFAPPPTYYPAYYVPVQPVGYVPVARPTWIGNFIFGPLWLPVYQQPPAPAPQRPQT